MTSKRSAVVAIVILSAVACGRADKAGETTVTSTTTPAADAPSATTTTVPEVETVSGSSTDGYAAVEDASTGARDRWHDAGIDSYGYLLEVECDCPQATVTRVARFAEWDEESRPIDELFDQITAVVGRHPQSIEVSFSTADGHPVSYRTVADDGEVLLTVSSFHEIGRTESPYDGSWRFLSGSIDGESFGNPPRWIYLDIDRGWITYPPDGCNRASGLVDVYDDWFVVGPTSQTLAGCDTPPQSTLFNESIQRVGQVALDGADLVLSGPGVELRFTAPPETPRVVGDLPLTSAGAQLSFAVPGDEATATYIITSRLDQYGRATSYLLTAATPGSETTATWEHWTGELAYPDTVTAPSPHTIIVPDDIQVGDYYLCSPSWLPGPFCFTLPVRLPSAPWFVTAGLDGIVLYDANGTSEVLTEAPTAAAFYVDDRLVFQLLDAMDQIQVEGSGPIALGADERLADVVLVDGHLAALVLGPDAATVIDLEMLDRTPVGLHATLGRLAGGLVVLRTSPERIGVYDTGTGDLLWEKAVTPETLATLDGTATLRLDTMRELQSEAGPAPYFQYVDTELVDLATGETADSFEWEVAIPEEGDNIDEPCGRADFNGELLMCPQPDGRIVTLEAVGGESRTFATGAIVATFARAEE